MHGKLCRSQCLEFLETSKASWKNKALCISSLNGFQPPFCIQQVSDLLLAFFSQINPSSTDKAKSQKGSFFTHHRAGLQFLNKIIYPAKNIFRNQLSVAWTRSPWDALGKEKTGPTALAGTNRTAWQTHARSNHSWQQNHYHPYQIHHVLPLKTENLGQLRTVLRKQFNGTAWGHFGSEQCNSCGRPDHPDPSEAHTKGFTQNPHTILLRHLNSACWFGSPKCSMGKTKEQSIDKSDVMWKEHVRKV